MDQIQRRKGSRMSNSRSYIDRAKEELGSELFDRLRSAIQKGFHLGNDKKTQYDYRLPLEPPKSNLNTYEPMDLDHIKMALSKGLQHLAILGYEIHAEKVNDRNRITAKFYLWGQDNREIEYRYPLDWWEMFKARWLPDWILERFPVRYKTHVIKSAWICPEEKHESPDKHFTIAQLSPKDPLHEYNRLGPLAEFPADRLEPKIIRLEKIQLGIQAELSEFEIENNLGSYFRPEYWITSINYMVSRKTKRDSVVKYPLDWWQALKETWAPGWFLKKHPVCYSTKIVDFDERISFDYDGEKHLFVKDHVITEDPKPIINEWYGF